MATDQALTAQALLLLNAAKTGPSIPLRIASLTQLAETWKRDPALLPVFLPHAYSIAAEPSIEIRCAVVELAEKVVCDEGFGLDLKGVGEVQFTLHCTCRSRALHGYELEKWEGRGRR